MSTAGPANGRVTGWITRHARAFHRNSHTFTARVVRHPELALDLEPLAERLVGDALVRFSGAREVLECAVRFRHDKAEPEGGDQDLLFAPVAPLTTNVEDYLANDYYAASPFDVGLLHAMYFRLRPERPTRHVIGDRDARIEDAVERGQAELELDVSASPRGTWSPIVRVDLLHAAHDQEPLGVRPHRVVPRAFVHALRRGVDAMSQWARPRTVP